MSWGIVESASDFEKIRAESADFLNGWNSCGIIDYEKYSEAFDFYHDLLEKAYKLGKADRPQGEWVEMGQNEDGTHNVKCNQCGNTYKLLGHAESIYTKYNYRFCPHCGARSRR